MLHDLGDLEDLSAYPDLELDPMYNVGDFGLEKQADETAREMLRGLLARRGIEQLGIRNILYKSSLKTHQELAHQTPPPSPEYARMVPYLRTLFATREQLSNFRAPEVRDFGYILARLNQEEHPENRQGR